jgi:hypothetical protein
MLKVNINSFRSIAKKASDMQLSLTVEFCVFPHSVSVDEFPLNILLLLLLLLLFVVVIVQSL